jgi:transposase
MTDTNPPASCPPSLPRFAGIDVAKEKLDLAVNDGASRVAFETFANDDAGIKRLVQRLAPLAVRCVVVESTGGLERPLLDALIDAALPAALVHPGRVRALARGLGIAAKTDRVDANVLAHFGKLAEPRLAEKRSASQAELQALVTCRRQLVATRARQFNFLESTSSKTAAKALRKVVELLDRQIEQLDKKVRELIDSDQEFKDLDRRLRQVPGVGPALSATLVAELPELGDVERRQIGALVGVVPYNVDSGRFQGKRAIAGGRADVRQTLYMATLSAVRYNPVIKPLVDRLAKVGKPWKVRMVAAMRKLLNLLNAMARDGLRWEELNVVQKLLPVT